MIKTQDLEYLIKLSVLSPYIKGERPVSMLVAARVESGKTEILEGYALQPCAGSQRCYCVWDTESIPEADLRGGD